MVHKRELLKTHEKPHLVFSKKLLDHLNDSCKTIILSDKTEIEILEHNHQYEKKKKKAPIKHKNMFLKVKLGD